MASTDRCVASITLKDGVKRTAVHSIYVSLTDAQEYWAAAKGAARDATKIGVYFAKTLGISAMVPVQQSVVLEQIEDTVTLPANTVLRGDKINFDYGGGGSFGQVAVPGRETGAFTQETTGLGVSITAPTAMSDYVAAFNNVAKTKFGSAATIISGKLND